MASPYTSSVPADCSTLANFGAWAGNVVFGGAQVGFSYQMGLAGFVQTADKGQAVWADSAKTLTSIVANSPTSGNVTVTAATHGFRVGQIVTITGTTNFNTSQVITATTTNTFTYAQSNSSTTETSGTATVKGFTQTANVLPGNNTTLQAIANGAYPTSFKGIYSAGTTYAVGDLVWYTEGTIFQTFLSIAGSNTGNTPAGGTADTKWQSYYYEMWGSNDALSGGQYYVKVEYGRCAAAQSTATNVPGMCITWGTTTDTNSKLTGNTTFREMIGATDATANTSNTECDFSSSTDGSRFASILWRTNTGGAIFLLGWEREHDNTGADTNNSITYFVGYSKNNVAGTFRQNSFKLAGSGPIAIAQVQTAFAVGASSTPTWGFFSIQQNATVTSNLAYSNTAIAPVFPMLGYFANPMKGIMTAQKGDVTEGAAFTITLYGSTRTYLPTKNTWVQNCLTALFAATTAAVAIRWD